LVAVLGLFALAQVVRILAAAFATRREASSSSLCVPFLVDLNSASAEELMALPGVGEGRAAAIILHRVRSGPFGCVEDLDSVEGIGASLVAQVRPFVRDPRAAR
jgi:competence protein ComEA